MTPEVSKTTNTSNNYSQSVSSPYPDNPMQWFCTTNKLTNSQLDEIENVQFWIDGVCQFIIGCIGIFSNLLAILILLRSKMIESMFNKFLTSLLILHSIYIAYKMLTEMIHPTWYSDAEHSPETAFTIYVSFILQPVGKFILYSSTFFTALMARQRYLASCSPIQYRQLTLTRNHQNYLIQNLTMVFLTSALFTFPIYLETSIKVGEIGKLYELNATHFKYVSSTNIHLLYRNIVN